IERLKIEKEILITKAISWLLRDLVKHHTKMVSQYISRNKNTLPAIAIRETLTKLKTGKKTPSSERVAQIHQTDPHH
ncbi:MAG: DNA alkylation repair protein, partial [Cyclobacteriaceae bacterium]|nr:DNA alkylation repair protein [Cyclobacteriaceae bacterium]